MTTQTDFKQFVFIVTYGRSGSTVLQHLLNQIPGWCIRGENNFALYHMFRAYQEAHNAKHGYTNLVRSSAFPWYGAHHIDLDGMCRRIYSTFVDDVLRAPGDCTVLGFKEIRWNQAGANLHAFLDFIRELFQPAKFVFNRRHVDAVVKSGFWLKEPEPVVRQIIANQDALFTSYCHKHPKDCHLLDYDTWSQSPVTLGPLYDFLQAPFNLAQIEQVLSQKLEH